LQAPVKGRALAPLWASYAFSTRLLLLEDLQAAGRLERCELAIKILMHG
jgi:hypothetical protein